MCPLQELFETFNEEGEPVGLFARDVVHKLGLWHCASNVFLFRSDGRLIVQQRHESKDVCPGTWDLSVAEHLEPGERFLAGALRGLREELGVTGVSLEPVSAVVRAKLDVAELGIKDYEFQVSFRGVSDAELMLQTAEVAEIRLCRVDELRAEMLTSPERFTPWFLGRARDVGLFG